MSKSIILKSNYEELYPHPFWPVNSIYLSISNENPCKWFGGTWQLIAQGRTLVGVDTNQNEFNVAKKTGGEKSHRLTIDEIPSHSHNYLAKYGPLNTPASALNWELGSTSYGEYGTSLVGGSQTHNNLQPYFCCYIWMRIK